MSYLPFTLVDFFGPLRLQLADRSQSTFQPYFAQSRKNERYFAKRRLMGNNGRLSPTAIFHLNQKKAYQFLIENLSPLSYFT
jgi:hypothetical protein